MSLALQIKEKEKEVRILILGLDNAGKTTILKRLCGEPIDTIEPTLGFNIQTLQHSNSGYNLNLWDVGGQTSIRAYWRNYFEATDGLIWVVDSSDQLRLQLCKDELLKLLQHEKLAGATLLIMANKQDVPGALSSQQIAQVLELNTAKPYENRHWSIRPCSAVTGDLLMQWIGWYKILEAVFSC